MNVTPQNNTSIHFYSKHKYRDTFGDVHIQYHDFDNGDNGDFDNLFTETNTQHCYNKSYKISIGVFMTQLQPKAIRYPLKWTLTLCLTQCIFSGNTHTVTKINHAPYQTIQYDDKGMFPAQLMDDSPIQVFIDNGATPSILPLSTYNKHPILQKYPKTKSTPIHIGRGTIELHFWIELPLKLGNQTIYIKVLVCDSECPYNILIGRTSLAHLSAWQDYATNKLYI